jgi:hypothetical protein
MAALATTPTLIGASDRYLAIATLNSVSGTSRSLPKIGSGLFGATEEPLNVKYLGGFIGRTTKTRAGSTPATSTTLVSDVQRLDVLAKLGCPVDVAT